VSIPWVGLVRRRFYRDTVAPPKTKYGRRQLRLSDGLSRSLWLLRKETKAADDDLVFTAGNGARIDASNLMARVLKPAAVEAGLGTWIREGRNGRRAESWVGFHTFRHTCASMLFRAGWNAAQVQPWLGHHKASFTLDTYIHLLAEDVPKPEFFDTLTGAAQRRRGRTVDIAAEAPYDRGETQRTGDPVLISHGGRRPWQIGVAGGSLN
jgi:integrase